MAVQTTQSGPGTSTKALIIGIVILVIILIADWSFHSHQAGARPVSVATAQQRAQMFSTMARKCHGDFNQLSAADQATLNKATGGNGAMVIRETALHDGIRS